MLEEPKDAIFREPRELRSRGRSVVVLYNTIRPQSSLGFPPPAPETASPPLPPSGSASLPLEAAMASRKLTLDLDHQTQTLHGNNALTINTDHSMGADHPVPAGRGCTRPGSFIAPRSNSVTTPGGALQTLEIILMPSMAVQI